jgi:hypothetical protein
MHGLGKLQLALQFANLFVNQRRYSPVFWISAATIEKSSSGSTLGRKLGSGNWLLVPNIVDRSTLGFIREYLPHKNQRGGILFTRRTDTVTTALACAEGQECEILELGLPDV